MVELPTLAPSDHDAVIGRDVSVGRNDDFGWSQPPQRLGEIFSGDRLQEKLAGGEVDGSEAGGRREGGRTGWRDGGGYRHQPVVAGAGQPTLFQQGAGGDRFNDFAANDSLGFARVLDLFAHRDAVAGGDQLADIVGGGFDRNAGERHPVAAAGEGNAEDAGGERRVVEKRLVEVAHPEQEDRVAMARFNLLVLPHERRRVGRLRHLRVHGAATTNGDPPIRRFSAMAASCASARVAKPPARTLRNPFSRTMSAV